MAAPAVGGSVQAFNDLPQEAALARLHECLHAPGWAAAVLAGRPYPDRESLLATAFRCAMVRDDPDLRSALSKHPRIGDRPAGAGADAEHSRREQGGVDASDAELAERLRLGNLAYEERFGQVFLIRAAGRSGAEILAALTERMANDPVTEAGCVRDQLAQIARLRLGGLLTELSPPEPSR